MRRNWNYTILHPHIVLWGLVRLELGLGLGRVSGCMPKNCYWFERSLSLYWQMKFHLSSRQGHEYDEWPRGKSESRKKKEDSPGKPERADDARHTSRETEISTREQEQADAGGSKHKSGDEKGRQGTENRKYDHEQEGRSGDRAKMRNKVRNGGFRTWNTRSTCPHLLSLEGHAFS